MGPGGPAMNLLTGGHVIFTSPKHRSLFIKSLVIAETGGALSLIGLASDKVPLLQNMKKFPLYNSFNCTIAIF